MPSSEMEKKVGPFLSAWTPQQDLGEESSSDGGEGEVPSKNASSSKYGRGHVFSLSLPRESHMAQYSEKTEKQSFNSLQKLKKTVSGAFGVGSGGSGGNGGNASQEKTENFRSDNWFLSRSAPNSIDNNCSNKNKSAVISNSTSDDHDDEAPKKPSHQAPQNNSITISIKPPSFSYLTGGKHMMYLPNHTVGESSDFKLDDEVDTDVRNGNETNVDDYKNEFDDEEPPIEPQNYYNKIELEDLQDPAPHKIVSFD